MSCVTALSQDILRDCQNPPVAGIEQKIVLISRSLLPRTGITKNATNPNELLDAITLTSGQGYIIEGQKQHLTYTNPFDVSADQRNGMKHTIAGIRWYDQTPAGRQQLNKLMAGENVFGVLERKWKGASSAHAFLFFGIEYGLEISEGNENAEENGGLALISLATPGDYQEPYLPHILLDTDYATTKTAFDNGFAAA